MQHHSPLFRWVSSLSFILIGATTPVVHDGDGLARAPYSVVEAEKTLTFAFTSMAERHLDPIDIAAIAMEGMRGLGNIDPDIGIQADEDNIRLIASDHVVADYPRPHKDSARAWARLAVTLSLDARPVSAAMRATGAEQLYEAIIDATLSRLDTFSRYSGQAEAREHRAARNGFGGLGIRFDLTEGEAHITDVMEDTPAAGGGLQVGDIITHIDGDTLAGMGKDEISRHLRGPVASDITLTIRRGLRPMDISLHRALIVPPTVSVQVHDGVATFHISAFNQRTAASMKQDLTKALAQNGGTLHGIILDLRGNPGGLLDQAVAVADLFMTDGIIVATRGRHPLASQTYDAHPGDSGEALPIVVIIDGKTASAGEILAAALQDSGRAVIIGSNSYGKGTVQTVIRLPNDGEMTLTWSRFHSSTGYALHNLGVMPTICTVPNTALQQSGRDEVQADLSLWRHTRIEDASMRGKLRALCPSTPLQDSRAEQALADHLIRHPEEYRSAVELSAPDKGTAGMAERGQ